MTQIQVLWAAATGAAIVLFALWRLRRADAVVDRFATLAEEIVPAVQDAIESIAHAGRATASFVEAIVDRQREASHSEAERALSQIESLRRDVQAIATMVGASQDPIYGPKGPPLSSEQNCAQDGLPRSDSPVVPVPQHAYTPPEPIPAGFTIFDPPDVIDAERRRLREEREAKILALVSVSDSDVRAEIETIQRALRGETGDEESFEEWRSKAQERHDRLLLLSEALSRRTTQSPPRPPIPPPPPPDAP